ncbi:MAG: SLBB domain-containing protein [Spirochaetia bacterium]
MIIWSLRSAFLLVVAILVGSMAFGQTTTSGAGITDTSRRIIHLDSYQPTPGDVYTLSINYGFNFETGSAARTEHIQLILNSDYSLEVPFVGSINVRTLSYDELRTEITGRVRDRVFAQFVTFNLTAPAIFDVLVWGGVNSPGFHSLTSLTRLTDALAVSGGTTSSGSRRKVELIRSGRTQVYDLLRYVSDGDDEQNPFIKPGDRIHVPLADSSVDLTGAVAQPGRMEILPGETVGDIIGLAGGLLPTAQADEAVVLRIGEGNRYSILSLAGVDVTTLPASAGDIINIPASTTTSELIQVEGAIYMTPAEEGSARSIPMVPILLDVPYTPGLTVLGLLERLGGPTPFAETDRSFIIRSGSGERSPIPDLGEMWDSRQWDRDIPLAPGDRLVIPMKRLLVSVRGQVNSPGAFSFTSGYVVADYLELAGSIVEQDGSAGRLYFAEPDGTLTRVDQDTAVPAGASIHVGRSGWGEAKQLFVNVFTVTGWVTGVIAVTTVIIEFIAIFIPNWP